MKTTTKIDNDKLKKFVKTNIVTEMQRIGEEIKTDAREYCPVDSGQLRDSITVAVTEDGTKIQVGSDKTYAMAVEVGTRHTSPQPYLRPALDKKR